MPYSNIVVHWGKVAIVPSQVHCGILPVRDLNDRHFSLTGGSDVICDEGG